MAKTQSTEDYIKAIYTLQKGSAVVTTSSLAGHLGVEDASVTGMLKKFSARKLVVYTPYKGAMLTPAGRKLATQIVRRHRLWEMFLVQFLGYRWDEVHDEAERLEHVTSGPMEYRLDKALGFPKVDPHGDPIPSVRGKIRRLKDHSLADCIPGDTVTIVRVDDNQEVLQYLFSLGLTLHRRVVVKKKLQVDGSLVVRAGQKEHFVSRRVAESIHVERA